MSILLFTGASGGGAEGDGVLAVAAPDGVHSSLQLFLPPSLPGRLLALQQIHLLELKKERLDSLLDLARGIKKIGVKAMSFEAFDTKKIDEYAKQAKASWGKTDAYKEYEQRSAGRSMEEQQTINVKMMEIFAEFGKIKDQRPDGEEATGLAKKLQDFITENFYTCTNEILLGLGAMYSGGGDFTTNIDKVGGEGTAVFADKAIQAYCRK